MLKKRLDSGEASIYVHAMIEPDLAPQALPQLARQQIVLNPDYLPPDLLRRPQAPRLRCFARSRILTGQASTFPVRSVAKTPYPQSLELPRDDRVVNKPG